MGRYYPIFLNIEGRACLVIGGGKVAERKVENLLKAGGAVTIISPRITERLLILVERGEIRHLSREYLPEEVKDYFLAVAATDDPEKNRQIFLEAEKYGILFNAVDQPDSCNFIFPAVVELGELIISISTSGASPALAREIRKFLQELFSSSIGGFVEELRKFRQKLLQEGKDPTKSDEYNRRVNEWKRFLKRR